MTAEISAAFADVPYPGDDRLVPPTGPMARIYRADFQSKHWRDIIDPEFLEEHSSVGELSVEGQRFYLPAYLIATIEHPDDSADLFDAWTHLLYPQIDDYPAKVKDYAMNEWDRFMNALTPRQKHAIRLFLEYLLAAQPDSWWLPEPPGNLLALMLANYWNQF